MEITVKGHRTSLSMAPGERKEFKKTDKTPKDTPMEAMNISSKGAPVKISPRAKQDNKNDVVGRDARNDKPTLKELQAKKYPFPNSDLPGMLDSLLDNNIIQLPKPKRPADVNKIDNPKYCCYHRMVSHNIENCITLKELIMRLIRDGTIEIPKDEAVKSNQTTATECPDIDEVATRVVDETVVKKVRHEWAAEVVMSLPSASKTQIVDPPPTSFVFLSNQAPVEKVTLKGRFDDNAHKLMEKSGYDFKHATPLGHGIEPHPYGLDQTRGAVPNNTSSSCKCPPLVKISTWRKEETSSAPYIAIQEVEEDDDEFGLLPHSSSVFDGIHSHARKLQPLVCDRIDMPARQKGLLSRKCSSIFSRLRAQNENNGTSAPRNRGHRSCERSKIFETSDFHRLGASLKRGEPTKSLLIKREATLRQGGTVLTWCKKSALTEHKKLGTKMACASAQSMGSF